MDIYESLFSVEDYWSDETHDGHSKRNDNTVDHAFFARVVFVRGVDDGD